MAKNIYLLKNSSGFEKYFSTRAKASKYLNEVVEEESRDDYKIQRVRFKDQEISD